MLSANGGGYPHLRKALFITDSFNLLSINVSPLARKVPCCGACLMFAERDGGRCSDDERGFDIEGFFLADVDDFISAVFAQRVDA